MKLNKISIIEIDCRGYENLEVLIVIEIREHYGNFPIVSYKDSFLDNLEGICIHYSYILCLRIILLFHCNDFIVVKVIGPVDGIEEGIIKNIKVFNSNVENLKVNMVFTFDNDDLEVNLVKV